MLTSYACVKNKRKRGLFSTKQKDVHTERLLG
ncbi:hypothetical protein SDEG_1637 [Streptococcus dysgalactiae subsp. equisimilis GGS_124]|nr:hypothetical protein SDEG_1637 [Streptococcus dysgalactiae subsp. equisimilis GGS_124]